MNNSVEISSVCKDCNLTDYIEVEVILNISKDETTASVYIPEPHQCRLAQVEPNHIKAGEEDE